jgi:hypothetical protein
MPLDTPIQGSKAAGQLNEGNGSSANFSIDYFVNTKIDTSGKITRLLNAALKWADRSDLAILKKIPSSLLIKLITWPTQRSGNKLW